MIGRIQGAYIEFTNRKNAETAAEKSFDNLKINGL